jgi:hypothetical protein
MHPNSIRSEIRQERFVFNIDDSFENETRNIHGQIGKNG